MEIKTEILPRIVAGQDWYGFDIPADGLYLITIIARCKNWWQNLLKLRFSDDDVAVQIDDFQFFELKGKKREFNSIGSWNGNELKNNSKAVILIVPFKVGEHRITFWADKSPLVEAIKVVALDTKTQNYNLSTPEGVKAVDLVLKNVSLIALEAVSSVKDSKKSLSSEKITLGMTAFGLFKVGQPVVNSIKIKIENYFKFKLGRVRLYPDMFFKSPINLRQAPSTQSDSIADIADGGEVEIITERVKGEYYVSASSSNIWHEVKWQNKQGYILSTLVEIQGQEREKIIDLITTACNDPDYNVDINIMLAIAGVESHFKPYAVGHTKEEILQIKNGEDEKNISSAQGVFQLRKDAANAVHIDDRLDLYKNVEGGVHYFKQIMDNKDIKGRGYILEQRLLAWHDGPTAVAAGRLDYKRLNPASDSAKFIKNVLANCQKRNWSNIILVAVIFIFVLGGSIFLNQINVSELTRVNFPPTATVNEPQGIVVRLDNINYRVAGKWQIFSQPLNGIGKAMLRNLKDEDGWAWTELVYWNKDGHQFKEILSDYFGHARREGNFFTVEREGVTNYTYTAFYNVRNGRLNRVPFVGKDGQVYDDGGDVLFLADRRVPTVEERYNHFIDPTESTYNETLKEYEFDARNNVFREVRTVERRQKISLHG